MKCGIRTSAQIGGCRTARHRSSAPWPEGLGTGSHGTATTASPPPDKTAYAERLGTTSDPGAWFVTVTLAMHQRVGQAGFGAHTPPRLVAAFTAALADPKPVHRMDSGRSLATLDPDVAARRTTDVLAAYVADSLEERVHSLAARHTTSPTVPNSARQAPPRHGLSR
ncbi:DUF317 domain-containing protein [Streptomyces sp. NPDC008092]|uniref:DUF317 domain-containing protein n=1 Tax=Streptomyces sp. NPDC008092 TaxID=3364808 RepID=UPI0036E2122C